MEHEVAEPKFRKRSDSSFCDRSAEEAKSYVRARDGYKCRDCGMTQEEHFREHGSQLQVHRLFPGSAYWPSWCVTLCHECHNKMPRKAIDAIEDSERSKVCVVFWNMFDADDKEIVGRIAELAKKRRENLAKTLDKALRIGLAELEGRHEHAKGRRLFA